MAKAKDTVVFNGETKQSGLRFPPATPIRFEGEGHADFFVLAGWADYSDEEPKMIIGADEIEVDPDTIHNATGLRVMDVESKLEA